MKKNAYAVFLLCILSISVLLLSLSYAKNSEKGINNAKDTLEKEDLQVVCSSSCTKMKTNEEIVIALTNKKDVEEKLVLSIPAIEQNKEVKIFINGQEQSANLYLIELSPYGETGDFKNITLEIKSEKESFYNLKIETYKEEENTLEKEIKKSPFVQQKEDNYYYYGENPSNYILYNETTYQIIGLVDNKIKLISPVLGLGTYKEENIYPTLQDYLHTFKEDIALNEALSYKSWMTGEKGFWLKDTEETLAYYASKYDGIEKSVKYVDLYIREVILLEKNTILLSGNGSKETPYEVEYASK